MQAFAPVGVNVSSPREREVSTRSCAWILNVCGLVISITAALLMFYFPPRVQLYTERGEPCSHRSRALGRSAGSLESNGIFEGGRNAND